MIFSRGSARRRDAGQSGDPGQSGRHIRSHRAGSEPDGIDSDATTHDRGAPSRSWLADDDDDPEQPDPGPYDVSHVPKDKLDRLDLGALRIPLVAGVEIQLQAGDDGHVRQVLLGYGASRLQLGVFAAPRTEGIWAEVRENVRAGLASAGAKPHEVDGDYGVELVGRMPDGAGHVDVRHVGIDGPRWFVHAVFMGAAATAPERAGPLREALRALVVDRGAQALPVGEALPLRLPAEAAAQLEGAARRPPVDRQAT